MTESEMLKRIAKIVNCESEFLEHPTTWKDCKYGTFMLYVVAVCHRAKRLQGDRLFTPERKHLCLMAAHIFSLSAPIFSDSEKMKDGEVRHSLLCAYCSLSHLLNCEPYTSYPDEFDFGLLPDLSGVTTGIANCGFITDETLPKWASYEAQVADIVRLYYPNGMEVLASVADDLGSV